MAGFDNLWDYSDPAKTEVVFRELLATTRGEERCELLTQIARSLGLQGRFREAEEVLDQAEGLLQGHMPRARIRCVLERGRVLNSSGDSTAARHLFVDAWHLSRANRNDGLAIDSAHMIAIVGSPDEAVEWNERAIALAEKSEDHDARKWMGSLYNNLGWTLHDLGRMADAHHAFVRALEARVEQGREENILIAKWCVAKSLRSLGRTEDALERQQSLREQYARLGRRSGFVEEEIAECLRLLGRQEEALPHYAVAYAELSMDADLAEREPERIARLKQMSNAAESRASVV